MPGKPISTLLQIVWVFCVVSLSSCSSSKNQAHSADFVTSQAADLKTTARSVLAAVQLGRAESVYLLLDTPTRRELSLEQLEASFAEWWPRASSNGDLRARIVVAVEEASATAIVGRSQETTEAGVESSDWTWYFVREESGWKVARFEGGPPLRVSE